MDVCSSTFTNEEVVDLLLQAGIEEGTPRFYQEKCRRFRPVDGRPGVYVESENWLNPPSSPPADQQAMHK